MNEINIFEMVMNYFRKFEHGVSSYEPVGVRPKNADERDNYLYLVMAQYTGENEFKKGTYAVWTCFNTETQSMNYGHYDMNLQSALDLFNGKDYGKVISYDRLSELATMFKDGLEQGDKEEALKYFIEECDMTDEELDYFGIEKPKKYKRVNVEVNFNFEMVIPEDVDEDYFATNGLNLGDILSEGCSENVYTDVREEGISEEKAESMLECDYYGELNPDYC